MPLALLLLLCLPASACQDAEPRAQEPARSPGVAAGAPSETLDVLEVRALANEGFLLTAGEDSVAIDAFVSQPYSIYGALSGEPLEHLRRGTGPFASLDLALTSHVHGDHFQSKPALRLLAARPDCLFASSRQVVETLWEIETDYLEAARRATVRTVLPEDGEEEEIRVGDIRVDVLRLSHGTGRHANIENLGHVITVGGVTALHVGDAMTNPANFEVYALSKRGIDVVFVPYWYFGNRAGQRIVDEHFRPARLVACHIPPAELAEVTAHLAREQPDVIVPQRTFELFRFADRN